MKKINDNSVLYFYLLATYVFALWLSLFIISDLKIAWLLIVALVIIAASVGQLSYIVLSNPTLYLLSDSLKIKRPFKINLETKLSQVILLEKVNFSIIIPPRFAYALIRKYRIVIRENGIEKSLSFYDTGFNQKNISEFANQIEKENSLLR